MDVLSISGNPSSFTINTYNNDKSSEGIENDILLGGTKTEQSSFRLNPLLNDSLNNLVKRFEKTKIPKPPPTKGQSIRKKSKLSNSLPNIFLPSGFEDTKYNIEKKVQWSNKLNLNLDRLKNAFRDTYDNWYQQKRSQSIPNLEKNEAVQSQLFSFKNTTEIDIINVSQKDVCDGENVTNRPLSKLGPWKSLYHEKLEHHIVPDNVRDANGDSCDISAKHPFSTHVYLDGAIIEPISPASPTDLVNLENSGKREIEQVPSISEIELAKEPVPVKRKKGRPKKIQNIVNTPTLFEKINEAVLHSKDIAIDNVNARSSKPVLTKKQKKLSEKNNPPFTHEVENVDASERPILTKKQKKSLERTKSIDTQHEGIGVDTNCNDDKKEDPREKHALTKKRKKSSAEEKIDIQSNFSSDDKADIAKKTALSKKQKKLLEKTKKAVTTTLFEVRNAEINADAIITNNDEEEFCEMPILTKKQQKSSQSKSQPHLLDSQKTELSVVDDCTDGHGKNPALTTRQKKVAKGMKSILVNNQNVELNIECNSRSNNEEDVGEMPSLTMEQKKLSENADPAVKGDAASEQPECEPTLEPITKEDHTKFPKKESRTSRKVKAVKAEQDSETSVDLDVIEQTEDGETTVNTDTNVAVEETHNAVKTVDESRKKPLRSKPGPRCKKKYLPEYDHDGEDITADAVASSDKPKQCSNTQEDVTCDSAKAVKEVIEDAVNESTRSDLQELTEQSNDIEVLSKSITDSVDTSMLPPRKRYKRLMYLDNSKQTSPNECTVVEDIAIHDPLPQEHLPEADNDIPTKKTANCLSRLKRKRSDKTESSGDTVDPFVETKEPSVSTEESVDKPSSLKRSKREAAARGFANMVAMSLNNNNSSQSHDSALGKEVATDVAANKMFKRPRKSANISALKPTGKGKFEFVDELDDDVIIIEPPKVIPKKARISRDSVSDNPPSPVDTVVSTNSSSHEALKYRKIRTNTYIDPKPQNWNQEVERCGCKPSSLNQSQDKTSKKSNTVWDCTDNCLNRLTYTECSPKSCPCGDSCDNQKIRKLEWAQGLKVTDIASKGRGVVTTKPIKEGTLIAEYVGEVIGEETFQERMINLYKEDAHHYCLHLDGEMLIDAYRSGSVARFVNHSCQPNCEMQKWMVNGAYRMCLFANEDIGLDTELSYDYNFCSFNTKTAQLCCCGTANCRGYIGGRPRAEQSESQRDRKKLLFAFGRLLSAREKLFVSRRAIFLVRARTLGRCRRLGIRRTRHTHGTKLPSTITEIKRRKAKKNQFLTQMSALNSIRSIRTRLLQTAQNNETLTRTAQLAQVLRDLYNTLLQQKDPLSPGQQLVAPFVHGLKPRKYPEFYSMLAVDTTVCLSQVYSRLLDGKYTTMMAFDHDILQMMQNVELYAGKQSNIGKCAERIKPVYKDLKMNAIALYEALTDELVDERDKNKLLSNNLTLITNAVKSHSSSLDTENTDSGSLSRNKRRKQGAPSLGPGNSRVRLERGAEVIKCVCGFLIEAGHVMVQCDRCFVWQHAYCMNVARSSDLIDVTRVEPYFCHICLNIATESLIREIPRNFVITNEIVESGNKLFWTLLHIDTSLLKIDDFVYVPSEDAPPSAVDLSQRTIMRIYSLWKDSSGQRWMEGGLFLRPYNPYLVSLSKSNKVDSGSKRKSNPVIDLSTHKWHHQEVVYTDLTRILPLDVCVGRCHVLNNHTFRLGKPLSQTMSNNGVIDDVYLCDWLINKDGEWSEIDPAYMKINTKPYCFERNLDSESSVCVNEKFLRQHTSEELLKFDQGATESSVPKHVRIKSGINQEEKRLLRVELFDKLVNKLAEFAFERSRKLPLSPPSSVGSRSAASSRGASPLCDNGGSKSPPIQSAEYFSHYRRKQRLPRKKGPILPPVATNTANTIASEYSESSPKLMIVVGDDAAPMETFPKMAEDQSSVDEKMSAVVSGSPQENVEEMSNPCSEIKYGDLLDLLKEAVKSTPAVAKGPKKPGRRGRKKTVVKRNVLKPVSEISSVDDNWLPSGGRQSSVTSRRETRSRKTSMEVLEEGEEDDDGPKTCFVKLERMRVTRAEKNRLKRVGEEEAVAGSDERSPPSVFLACGESHPARETRLEDDDATPASALDRDAFNPTASSAAANSRSKRKKGVPKRIPFDFTFQTLKPAVTVEQSGVPVASDYEVVDLSSGKCGHADRPDQTTSECQQIESPDMAASVLAKQATKSSVTAATEARHITAANDFSSIENISSN